MGMIYFLGNALLSVVSSLLATTIDRHMQNRKKKEPTPRKSKGS